MRLRGLGAEKSHSFYLIIYQVFKSIFLIENETMRLFLQKKLFHVSENNIPFNGNTYGSPVKVCGLGIDLH